MDAVRDSGSCPPENPLVKGSVPASGEPTAEVERIPIDRLRSSFSPRMSGEDEEHVLRLAETDEKLPPILVHRPTMRVIDGMHRLRAAILKGSREIDVRYFHGTGEEAFIQAVRENVVHGLPLSLAERKNAAEKIIRSHPELSDRGIGACTGLSGTTVAAIRRRCAGDSPEPDVRIGTDGRARPLGAAEGRRRVLEAIEARPQASLREIAKAARVSLSTAHDVRKRLRNGLDPIPPGSRAAGTGRPGTPPRSPAEVLDGLTRDPALRHTEPGRELLTRLRASIMDLEDRRRLADGVPAHCVEGVAGLARQCAEIWNRLADELSRRDRS
ncbi:ParB N-terminal domain-containing protein [Actinomadura kijaniata]|uniref:ParB/RepB/Spo0J family partition protein n=1 Tax=Actinomadura kijaniata TaxID=46161 RepID=UPI003F1C2C68